MHLASRTVCVCFPSCDRAFARFVEQLLPEGRGDPAVFQGRLRGVYPAAVVRPREISGETLATWYVYRDGGALAAFGAADWWRGPGLGHLRTSNGVILEANDVVHELLGYRLGSLIGQPSTILLLPHVEVDAPLLVEIFREMGLMESTLPVRTASGAMTVVEHRTQLQPDGSVTAVVRPVAIVGRTEPLAVD